MNDSQSFNIKKIDLISVILVISILIGGIFLWQRERLRENSEWKDYSETVYYLEGKKYFLLVADAQEKYEKGLMNVRKPFKYDGMIFIYPAKIFHTFWNKNTFEDLDIYWVDGESVVGKSKLPSIEKSKDIVTVSSPEKADKVVEIIRP